MMGPSLASPSVMDSRLSAEHEMVVRMVRDFAQKEVAPTIRDWDRKQEMAPHVLPRMAELGILGICLPERYGGQGFDYLTLGLVCEELEAVDTTLRVVMSVHMGLNSMALLQWGTEAQRQTFLLPQARGEKLAGFGLTEPGVGSDVAAMASTARREGEDYILNGEKNEMGLVHLPVYPSSVQLHYSSADGLKFVLHLEVVEGRVPGQNLFQDLSQFRDVPLSVPQII